MRRRTFLNGAALFAAEGLSRPLLAAARNEPGGNGSGLGESQAAPSDRPALKPMAIGLMIQPANGAEAVLARVRALGMSNCFLSLDGYIGRYTPGLARQMGDLLRKYELTGQASDQDDAPRRRQVRK